MRIQKSSRREVVVSLVILSIIASGLIGAVIGSAFSYEAGEKAGYGIGYKAGEGVVNQTTYEEGYNAAYDEMEPKLEEFIKAVEVQYNVALSQNTKQTYFCNTNFYNSSASTFCY